MFGCTRKDGSARLAPHAASRDWSFNGNHAKRGKFAIVGKGPREAVTRDRTAKRKEVVPKYPPELVQAAGSLGITCEKLLGQLAAARAFSTK